MRLKPTAFLTFAFALSSLAATPALAQASDGASATSPPAAKPDDKSKRICKTVIPSGTRMSKRVCRSAADWEEQARKAGDFLEQGQMDGTRRDGEFNTPH